MHCPFCSFEETKVIDSRLVDECDKVKRRRECIRCQERFTTYEVAELHMPMVIKRDGRRCTFDESKITEGMKKALEKRPVSMEDIAVAVTHVISHIRASGDREIQSNRIGEWVIEELRKLDQVAYVRFASVYRSFQDIDAFYNEVNSLKSKELEHAET